MKCRKCGTETKMKTITFSYDGFNFETFRPELVCPDCEKGEIIDEFEEVRNGLISKADGEIKIDWSSFGLLNNRKRGKVRKQFRVLIALGILTIKPESNWMISGATTSLNPRAPEVPGLFFFTRKSDVVAYARENWSDPSYPWQIVKNGGPIELPKIEIPKKEVMKENLEE